MYIVAIGWLYVTLMMAITSNTIFAGVMTFVFYGLIPCSVLMWLMGTPMRGRARRKKLLLDLQQDGQQELQQKSVLEDGDSVNQGTDKANAADTKRN